jgi:hypothetical protein
MQAREHPAAGYHPVAALAMGPMLAGTLLPTPLFQLYHRLCDLRRVADPLTAAPRRPLRHARPPHHDRDRARPPRARLAGLRLRARLALANRRAHRPNTAPKRSRRFWSRAIPATASPRSGSASPQHSSGSTHRSSARRSSAAPSPSRSPCSQRIATSAPRARNGFDVWS